MSERIYETYVGSRRLLALVMCGVGIMTADFRMSAQPAPAQSPVFRSSINLVLVDVVVKDKRGAMVRGLTANDFELREDGVRQQILTFAFEEIGTNAAPLAGAVSLAATATKPATVPSTDRATASASSTKPATSEDVAGHRLITIVFDTSSMQPEDVQRAADSATTWVDDHMTSADLVAVATIGSTLRVLADFTSSKEAVRAVLCGHRRGKRRGNHRLDACRPKRAGARHVQQRRAAARAQDARRRAQARAAEEGDRVFQLRNGSQRHRQSGRAAGRC